jgi:hypothetical protein
LTKQQSIPQRETLEQKVAAPHTELQQQRDKAVAAGDR